MVYARIFITLLLCVTNQLAYNQLTTKMKSMAKTRHCSLLNKFTINRITHGPTNIWLLYSAQWRLYQVKLGANYFLLFDKRSLTARQNLTKSQPLAFRAKTVQKIYNDKIVSKAKCSGHLLQQFQQVVTDLLEASVKHFATFSKLLLFLSVARHFLFVCFDFL